MKFVQRVILLLMACSCLAQPNELIFDDFFREVDSGDTISIQAAGGQLTITPGANLSVTSMTIKNCNCSGGGTASCVASVCSCSSGTLTETTATLTQTKTLIGGHAYITTDASNFSMRSAAPTSLPNYLANKTAQVYTFQPGGQLNCINSTNNQCTNVNTCGWSTAQTWAP